MRVSLCLVWGWGRMTRGGIRLPFPSSGVSTASYCMSADNRMSHEGPTGLEFDASSLLKGLSEEG